MAKMEETHRTFMVHAQNDYEAALDFLDEQRELRAARRAARLAKLNGK
jgi:hypothetical protein